MNDSLFQSKPISLGLSATKLAKPTQPIPGSGVYNSVTNALGRAFTPPQTAPATHPSLLSGFGSYQAPGLLGNISSQMPGLPSMSAKPAQPVDAPAVSAASTTPAGGPPPVNVSAQPSQNELEGLSSQIKALQRGISQLKPQNFQLGDTDTYESDHLNGSPKSELVDLRNKKEADMFRGLNDDGTPNSYTPSNSFYAKLLNNLYNASTYSPEERAALDQYNYATSQINAKNLLARRQIKSLQENGDITKEQSDPMIQEAQRRANAELADLAVAQQAATLSLDTFGKIRGNTVDALKNTLGFLQPTQVGVGSTLYNPVTGVMYQPGAQATDTIAQGLVDGSISPSQIPAGVNPSVVLERANQISMANTGSPFNASQAEANYVATKQAIEQNATSYRTLSNAQQTAVQHLDLALNYANGLAGIAGLGNVPAKNKVVLAARRAVGDKLVGQYDTALSIARSEIATVLGKGQPTAGFLDEAKNMLPDNLGPKQLTAKVETIKKLMADKIKEYSNLSNVPQYGQPESQSSGSAIINTKVGPVDNSWFQ